MCMRDCARPRLRLRVSLSISVSLSIYLSLYLSIPLSLYLSISLSTCIEQRRAQGEGEEGGGPVHEAGAEEEGGDHAEQRDVEPYGLLVGQRRVLFEARPEGVRSRAAWVFLTCLGSSARLGVRGLGVSVAYEEWVVDDARPPHPPP